jgi:hypothetical protein
MLSWSLPFTSKAGGTTAAENPTFLTKEQWLEVRPMQIVDNVIEEIKI